MTKGASQHVHPDFSGQTDTVLVATDGTEFHVEASDLSRSSGWFRTLFTVPQGDKKALNLPHSVTVDEDSLTLEILLKLGCGLPPRLGRLTNLTDLERMLLAAEKYEMDGAVELLALLLRKPEMQDDAIHFYAVAGRYGPRDLASGAVERLSRMPLDFATVTHLDAPQITNLAARRQHRIERFCAHALHGPFFREYPQDCPHRWVSTPPQGQRAARLESHNTKSDATLLRWVALVSALQGASVRHPSVDALEEDSSVSIALKNLAAASCSTCQLPQYDWIDIKARLFALVH